MSKIYIIHHLGLGDQLTLNGMVRHFIGHGNEVKVLARESHRPTSKFMYRDLDKDKFSLDFLDSRELIPSPSRIWERAEELKKEGYEIKPLATYVIPENEWNWFTIGPGKIMSNWLQSTYIVGNVKPEYMKEKFHVDRDMEREMEVFNKFGLVEDEYTFVHDCASRDIVIDVGGETFNPDHHYKEYPNIFDYLTIIEKAKEVRCFGSSYAMLIELMNIKCKGKNLFYTFPNASGSLTEREVKLTYSDTLWTFV